MTSTDGMAADYYSFEHAFSGRVAVRIINEVRGTNRVTYGITCQPPGRSSGREGAEKMVDDMKPASRAFQEFVLNDLLPMYCNDPSRGWGTAGFKAAWEKIAEVDAADFLRGIDGELIKHEERGLYRAPRSSAREQFFWPGVKQKTPRVMTLWVEPIITVAVLARLHFDLGWPKEALGTQSKDWAFDVTTYLSPNHEGEHIACEVKKSTTEIDQLVEHMIGFGKVPSTDLAPKGKLLNAFKKLQALRSRRPPLFWAVGPAGANSAFRMGYLGDGTVSFQQIAVRELGYDRAR